MKLRFLVAVLSISFSTTFAQQIQPKFDGVTNKFAIDVAIPAERIVQKTILFKVKSEFRSNCLINAITEPSLSVLINDLGIATLSKKFPNEKPLTALVNAKGLPLVDLSLWYELKYNAEVPLEEAINAFYRTGKVIFAEPNILRVVSKFVPNDPDTIGNKNYYLDIIKAYDAWTINKGDTNVVIGIVDSGSDLDHPDLAANMKHNYADPINGLDDDNDGFIDNFTGWDIAGSDFNNIQADNDANVTGNNNNHGSHVSGCASAVSDNNTGVAGVGYKCKLLPVKCSADNDTRSNGSGFILGGTDGIKYAADHGANVINCSFGGTGSSSFDQDVINFATINNGCLVVAAAGNDNSSDLQFPAAYDNVFCVASTNSTDTRSGFSNFGTYIDVAAPGSGIYTTIFNDRYAFLDGTSMASPIAAGAAALVKSQYPELQGAELGEQLRATADNIDAKNPNFATQLGSGRINVFKALQYSGPSVRNLSYVLSAADTLYQSGDTITLDASFSNYLRSTKYLKVTLTASSANIKMIDSVYEIGNMILREEYAKPTPFKFVILADENINQIVNLFFNYTDSAYTSQEKVIFKYNPDYLHYAKNQITTTVNATGRIGYTNGNEDRGTGFGLNYTGQDLLNEMGLMMGISQTRVSDVVRANGVNYNNHFRNVKRIKRTQVSENKEISGGQFNDIGQTAAKRLNVLVSHKEIVSNANGEDKYMIFQYDIKNNGAAELTNFYAGMFSDFNIGQNNSQKALNITASDEANKMGYTYFTGNNGRYAGVKLLNNFDKYKYIGLSTTSASASADLSDGFSSAEKYLTLSSNENSGMGTGSGEDVAQVVSVGPFNIPAGDSVRFVFALVVGDNLNDIKTSAANAQNNYDNVLAVNNKNSEKSINNLTVYPNPNFGDFDVRFKLPSVANVAVNVLDIQGKIIKSINPKMYSAGSHTLNIELGNIPAANYVVALTANGKTIASTIVVQK